MIEGIKETYIHSISISTQPLEKIDEEERKTILCKVIREKGLKILNWGDEITQWQARIHSLKIWRPNEDWPDVSDGKLVVSLEEWLAPYLTNINKQRELEKLDRETILSGFLSWELNQQLDMLAPHRLKVPSGSTIKLKYYADGSSPEMAVRLQEVFGLIDTPTVNGGRNKVLMHLLSPAYRPVQVTQDLKSFWTTIYPQVRKELRIRYLKHSWPEDPFIAEAIRGVKRKK
jgi:ATP-dependent helicase HrpB